MFVLFLIVVEMEPASKHFIGRCIPCVSQTNDSSVMYTVNSCIKFQVLFKITTLWTTQEF